jgi:hypothetical protein
MNLDSLIYIAPTAFFFIWLIVDSISSREKSSNIMRLEKQIMHLEKQVWELKKKIDKSNNI